MAIHPKYTDPNSPDYNPSAAESQRRVGEHNLRAGMIQENVFILLTALESSPLNQIEEMEHYMNSCKTILREVYKRPFAQHIC